MLYLRVALVGYTLQSLADGGGRFKGRGDDGEFYGRVGLWGYGL